MERPRTLTDLSRQLGLGLTEINIQCIFCKFWLRRIDLSTFIRKSLNLAWRGGYPYACCRSCSKVIAERERNQYYETSAKGPRVERLHGRPIGEIAVRCILCLSLLSYFEKVDVIERGESFYRVRDRWRAKCRECRAQQDARA
ncbi:E6 [Equus caballus papillomavirus 8]|uniref:Protein E6 n=1 Tax=Equus caballus papillomavirus 8 TaxID=1912759 RepID=A0A1D9EPU9_9PAPI|nr:E6 [Equus caballus papillomavirus 8]AOY65114.1 E6 [Equus caballus papillomavirus 8]